MEWWNERRRRGSKRRAAWRIVASIFNPPEPFPPITLIHILFRLHCVAFCIALGAPVCSPRWITAYLSLFAGPVHKYMYIHDWRYIRKSNRCTGVQTVVHIGTTFTLYVLFFFASLFIVRGDLVEHHNPGAEDPYYTGEFILLLRSMINTRFVPITVELFISNIFADILVCEIFVFIKIIVRYGMEISRQFSFNC